MRFEDILSATRVESELRRSKDSMKSLRHKVRDLAPTLGFARALASRNCSVIAEVKTKSPSMGPMPALAQKDAATVHRTYNLHPVVSAISVVTQRTHFGGSEQIFGLIRRETRKPILRKDFIEDEYEVYYSRWLGADAILLMTNVVTDPKKFEALHDLAASLGMDVLCEVHAEDEIALVPGSAKICGINSRKFKSQRRFLASHLIRRFGKDISTDLAAFDLFGKLPQHCLKIAESGVGSKNIGEIL